MMPSAWLGRISPKPPTGPARARSGGEDGIALIITLIALSMLSLLGFYMTLDATTEARISDNYESRIQANYAAQAGLNHAREAIRGLPIETHLPGPDAVYVNTASYLTTARATAFRNPLTWALARSMNIVNPAADIAILADDGVMNTGKIGASNGTPIIPLVGNVWSQVNPNGPGNSIIGRYFVKITDNNGEATELAADPSDNPFFDGDHIVIARSMGIAATIREDSAAAVRRNSVVVYEAKYRQRTTFDLDAPFVVEGDDVNPSGPKMWDGNAFRIDGGANNFGIATIDTNTGNGIFPTQQISSRLAANQANRIVGMGASPSISDITNLVQNDPDKVLLRNPAYLWNLVHNVIPSFADNKFFSDQHWTSNNGPDLGSIDINKPYNDPSQNPKITFVDGDLDIGGNLVGGGLLVVTGTVNGNGALTFNGLILVIGEGEVDGSGLNIGINGGMFVANLTLVNGVPTFGTPKFTWRGNSNIRINSQTIQMGMDLMPPEQIGWREITSIIDP